MPTPVLKLGSSGVDVAALQQALVEAGFGISASELRLLRFASTTERAVVAYQQAHGLKPDGVVGPKTWASLTLASATAAPPSWRIDTGGQDIDPVLARAMSMVGVTEEPTGSNRGPVIDELNRAASIPLGSPWCAAFATGMWQYSPKNPFKAALGSVLKVERWGRSRNACLSGDRAAMPGDIFLILRTAIKGHAGLVTADLGSRVCTVEGNAGNMVKQLIRPKSDISWFVRPLGIAAPVVA